MAFIPDEVLREVVAATDLVDLVGRTVTLRRSGTTFSGLCPFHREKTPSFNVWPHTQTWKCFGCGKGGDAIAFVRESDQVSFVEAVRALADRAGVRLPESGGGETATGPRRADVLSTLEWAAGFFRAALESAAGAEAARYVASRGIRPEAAEEFRLGYAPADPEALPRAAARERLLREVLEAAGLVRTREGARPWSWFRDRLIFPIADAQGRVVGFGARLLRGEEGGPAGPKYLNSPDSALFSKRRLLYGLPQARKAPEGAPLLVMEGYTDVIHAHQAGVPGAIATLGTALGGDHVTALRRLGREVVVVYDGDKPGLDAADRAADLTLAEDLAASLVAIPGGEDPADMLQRGGGADEFRRLLGGRIEAVAFRLSRLSGRHDLATHAGRRAAAEEMAALLAKVANPVSAGLLARRAAEAVGVSEEDLRRRAREILAPSRRVPREEAAPAPAPDLPPETLAELDCVVAVCADTGLADEAERTVPPVALRDPRARALYEKALALARAGGTLPRDLVSLFGEDPDRPYVALLSGGGPEAPPADLLRAAAARFARRGLEAEAARHERELAAAQARRDEEAEVASLRQLVEVRRRLHSVVPATGATPAAGVAG